MHLFASAPALNRLVPTRLAPTRLAIALLLVFPPAVHSTEPVVPHLRFEHPQQADTDAEQGITLRGADARWQLQVTAALPDQLVDMTQTVRYEVSPAGIVSVDETGFVTPTGNGTATVRAISDGLTPTSMNVVVEGFRENQPVNFSNQVIPIFTKYGCNGGGCHGKAAGQAGFKLSLLGFEPREDYEHLVHESRGRRLFPSAPDQSLLLLKAVNVAPHGGGQRLDVDSHEYRLLKRWIGGGMPFGSDQDPVVERIEVQPAARTLAKESTQQLCVIAHYSDGHVEDITRTAQFESNNADLAEVDTRGFVRLGKRPGDVAVMARYQGQVGVFRASIPLGVKVASWPTPANLVDELVQHKLKNLGIPPSDLCDDATYIRRVSLDLIGRLPTTFETTRFLDSQTPERYAVLVDRLLDSEEHAEFFAKKWSTILRNRRDGAGHQFGTFAFFHWLRSSLHENKPYDQLVRELLTASGSVDQNPATAWFRHVSTTESRVEDTAQLFLGQRLQCARCHHHPFEKWSQKDYYQMAAFFSKVQKKEGDRPEEPVFFTRAGGAGARHPKTGENLKPAGLDGATLDIANHEDPRVALVDWMVEPENPFFSRSLVNRYWKHFFAVGLVEPEDDMRVTNPPSNPELMDGLAEYFVEQQFDLKALTRLICLSNVYRQSASDNAHNLGDQNSYSRFYPKRLTAEVLLDAIDQVTMTRTSFTGLPADTRAVALPDPSYSSYFLDVFGRPDSATACECERSNEATLAQSLHLLNSKEVQAKLRSDEGRAAAMAASSDPPQQLVRSLYLAALSREPEAAELTTAVDYLQARESKKREACEDLVWAIINSKEFLFNH